MNPMAEPTPDHDVPSGGTSPADPMSPADELAASLHEWFRSLTAPGRFTHLQACVIIGVTLAHSGAGGSHTEST